MGSKKTISSAINEVTEFLNQLLVEKPLLPLVIPVLLVVWFIEKWVFSLSNWVPLAVAVWATIQYGSYQRRILAEDLNKKWKQVILQTSPMTPLEHCEWLNKLLTEVWPKYIGPKLALRFSSIVERRLKRRKPKLIEKIELQGFSLGSHPPILGLHGTRWSTSGDQQILRFGFDWDTTDISIMLFAKLAKPLMGTARIVINSLHIKGDILLIPVLDGRALLYSFITTPVVRIGVAFGSGGSQSLPATELPGVSSWLVKLVTDTINKKMVEPRRNCLALPAVDLYKKAVGGVLYVTVISASKVSRSNLRGSPTRRQHSSVIDGYKEDDYKDLLTFVEVELEELTRRTKERHGSSPRWDSTFNMVLHDNSGVIRFNLYECNPGSMKYDYLTSCEIKVRYVADDSTIFWATGADSTVVAKRAEICGKEINMTVPFEGVNSGELTVKLVLKEWQFSDGSHSLSSLRLGSRQSLNGSSSFVPTTGRKIYVTVVEGKNLVVKDRLGKSDPYVKLQYGKAIQRTRPVSHTSDPTWNQKFELDEIVDGEYLKIKCFIEETFGEESIGSARVNLEGLVEGSPRDVWIPLEKVNSGELHLQIEAVRVDDGEGSKGLNGRSANGWVELVMIEGRDLVAADLRGTSDPYVRIHYGNLKRRTKVIHRTLNPQWHQTFEFPDDGSPLELHVKDHNALLPTSSIGDCVVEYKRLPPNHMSDKWIPLQGVKKGEIHIQVTRKVPELEKNWSVARVTHQIELAGIDGHGCALYCGTGCFHRRVSLCGRKFSEDYRSEWYSVKDETEGRNVEELEESSKLVANCSYEDGTQWGKKLGLVYGCPVEDIGTGLTIQCRGWKPVYYNPCRYAFLGIAATTLDQALVQHKRWSEGMFQIFSSKYCPFIYGHGKIKLGAQMGYCIYLLWAPISFASICYVIAPSLCLLRGIHTLPEVSSLWFLPFAYVFAAIYAYSFGEARSCGGTLKSWWNSQRIWLFRRTTSYFFAFIDTIIRQLGFSQTTFIVIAKVVDDDVMNRYKNEILEFGSSSIMFTIIAAISMLNIFSFIWGIKNVILATAPVRAMDQFIPQIILSGLVVMINIPVYQALFFRTDKGHIPYSVLWKSIAIVSIASLIPIY